MVPNPPLSWRSLVRAALITSVVCAAVLSSCATGRSPAVGDPVAPQTLEAAAALRAEGADGAQCAVGRYRVETGSGVVFAMVSMGDWITLAPVSGSAEPPGSAFDRGERRLVYVPSSRGARYESADGTIIFESVGEQATVQVGGRRLRARVQPVVFAGADVQS